jgi:hypothetical protein
LKSSFSLSLFGKAGGKGGEGIPLTEPVNKIGSDFFQILSASLLDNFSRFFYFYSFSLGVKNESQK